MMTKILLLVIFLSLAAIILMPLTMPSCDFNGFHLGWARLDNACGRVSFLVHLAFMRSLIFVGLLTVMLTLARVIFKTRLFSLISINKKFRHHFNFLFRPWAMGAMKPFDRLLQAYAKGLAQPKLFYPVPLSIFI